MNGIIDILTDKIRRVINQTPETFTCSKSTIETPEKDVNYVQS